MSESKKPEKEEIPEIHSFKRALQLAAKKKIQEIQSKRVVFANEVKESGKIVLNNSKEIELKEGQFIFIIGGENNED